MQNIPQYRGMFYKKILFEIVENNYPGLFDSLAKAESLKE
jgi:hypothetical protein